MKNEGCVFFLHSVYKQMSSVVRAPSQLRPNAFYRVSSASTQIFDAAGATGADAFTVGANVVLADMGKTIYLGSNVLRKVKALGRAGDSTGYIYLVKAGGISQDIAAL